MAAYHLEALRRQRVIDRKHGALTRMAAEEEEEERKLLEELERNVREKLEEEENRHRERAEHIRQCGRAGRKNKQIQVQMLTQQDLRHQQKVLRDHGLVMGHVNDKFLS